MLRQLWISDILYTAYKTTSLVSSELKDQIANGTDFFNIGEIYSNEDFWKAYEQPC
jgi:hypothetical protein